jgi:hypothetical protein
MRGRNLVVASTIAALSLFASGAWAVQTGVQVSGVNPGDIASGTISFGSQPAQALVSRDDCEQQKKEGEDCDRAFLWFARTNSAPAVGTAVKVTLTDRKGNTTTGTGTVTEGGIRVEVPAFPASTPRTASAGKPGFRVGFGYDEQSLPPDNGGLGIRFTAGSPGSEFFIVQSPEDFDGEVAEVRVSTPFGYTFMSRKAYLGFLALFGEWDADESTVFPAGADSRGWAYQVESAPNGSTGLGLPGAFEMELAVDHEVEEWGFGVDLHTPPSDNGMSYGLGLLYKQVEQDIINGVALPDFTGPNLVASAMSQKVQDRFLLLPFTVRRSWNHEGDVSPYLQAVLAPGYHDSKLRGTFVSMCNLCGPDELLVEQTIDDSDSGFTFEAGIGTGINFRLGDRFMVGMSANYGYRDRLSYADNRVSPLDDPPHLGDADSDFWSVGINFGLELRY